MLIFECSLLYCQLFTLQSYDNMDGQFKWTLQVLFARCETIIKYFLEREFNAYILLFAFILSAVYKICL